LEVAQGIQAGEDAFNEAVAKIVATRHLFAERIERADHLSELKKVIEAEPVTIRQDFLVMGTIELLEPGR
jgi:hypothetical protein